MSEIDYDNNREAVLEIIGKKLLADCSIHRRNIELMCDCPVGIGDHGNIVETIMGELEKYERASSLMETASEMIDEYTQVKV
jgi:hypothetical protein